MSFLVVVNRLDVLINRMERLIAAITGKPLPDEKPPVIMVEQALLNNRYYIFEKDLSVVRADEALGIQELVKKHGVEHCRYMTILALPAALQYKVNDTGAPAADASLGEELEFEITEIYLTNAALAGTAKIWVEFRVD